MQLLLSYSLQQFKNENCIHNIPILMPSVTALATQPLLKLPYCSPCTKFFNNLSPMNLKAKAYNRLSIIQNIVQQPQHMQCALNTSIYAYASGSCVQETTFNHLLLLEI